jgi:hydroxyacylglutathione hydrolase
MRLGRIGFDNVGGYLDGKGSLNIPLPHLDERIGDIPTGRAVVVHCEGGFRSAIAASVLRNLGRAVVHDMVGGYKAWLAAKLPVESGPQPT